VEKRKALIQEAGFKIQVAGFWCLILQTGLCSEGTAIANEDGMAVV
jgi:hypothetical protein